MSKGYTRNPNSFCSVCKKAIYRRPSEVASGRIFCSSSCYGQSNRRETPCVVCGTAILSGANKKTCSRSCSNTNRAGISYRVGAPKDKVKTGRAIKLRVVALRGPTCERCKYAIVEVLHVHHRDRNHANNDFSNLELICPNCHYEEHYLEKSSYKKSLKKLSNKLP